MPIRKKVVSNSFVLSVKSKDGNSISITSKEVKYATSSSYVDPATLAASAWSTSYPASLPEGTWMHTRTTVVYSDGSSTVSYMSSYVGRNGTSPIFADITNEHGGVVCDSSGNTTGGEQSVSTKALMYLGNTLQTLTSIVCKVEGTTLGTAYTDNADPTRCFRAVSYPSTGTITVYVRNGSYLKTEDVIITVSANINGSTVSKDLRLSLSGSWAGPDGAPAVLYELEPSVDVVSRDSDSIPLYDSISFKVKKSVGGTISEVSNWSTEGLTLYHNIGGNDVSDGTVSGATKTISGIQNGLYAENDKVEWILKKGDDVVDREGIGCVDNGEPGNDSIIATITKSVGVVPCDSSGNTTSAQNVDAYVAIEKGGVAQTITGIACKIDDSYELGTSYASDGSPTPAVNFKKTTTLNSGYVKITIKSGTSLSSPTKIVITVTATIDGVSTSRKVTLTIEGQIPGGKGDTGNDGKSVYGLSLSPNCVKLKKDFANVVSATPSTFTLSLQYNGANISLPSGYYLYYRADGSGSWNSTSLGSKNTKSLFSSGSRSTLEFVMSTASSNQGVEDSNIVARASVSSIWEINRMLIPAGEYEDKEYTRTGTITPLVHKKVSGISTEYWYLDADTNRYWDSTSSSYKVAAPADNSEYWKQATYFDVILTKMLFAEFARLSSFIVYDKYFFSQYGTLVGPSSEIVVNASKVNTNYNGITPIVLNGNGEDDGVIVYKVVFYATANSQIKITLTPSSEANYDFGAIGVLGTDASPGNAKWLESATAATIKSTTEGTYFLKKSSGTTAKDTTITISSAGTYFIEIAYAKDGSAEGNDDKATFLFEKKSGTVTWKSMTRVSGNNDMTCKGYCMSSVPYGWFDPDDPMAEIAPITGYKFRPTKCIDALTGEEWGTNVHLSGEIHATSGEFTGTVRAKNFFHGVCIVYSEEWYYLNYKPTVTLNGDGDIDCSTQSEYDMEMAFWKDYEQGKYYQWTAERKASLYGSPLSNIENSPYTPVFVPCTGPADIVAIPNTANDTGDITIVLPCASDFDGKIVEIVDTRYTQPSSSYYIGNLLVRQADGSSKMKGTFTGQPLYSLTMNGNYEHDGESHRLLSYEGYWVKLRTS